MHLGQMNKNSDYLKIISVVVGIPKIQNPADNRSCGICDLKKWCHQE